MNERGSTVSMWFKIGFYLFASLLIGLEAQIDNIQNMDSFHTLDWIKLVIKSILPEIINLATPFCNISKCSSQYPNPIPLWLNELVVCL
jgi:hypothetical protein